MGGNIYEKKIIILVVIALIILGAIFIKMSKGDAQYSIGIGQFADHVSLDNCREGFIEGLRQEGIIEGENLKLIIKMQMQMVEQQI